MTPAYWRLWWATGIDNLGDGAFAAAVPLLAVTITDDPRLVSVLAAAIYLPWLLFSLPAGALVDRLDRPTLMWISQFAQATVVGTVAVLAALGALGIPTLALLAFALGACDVVVGNAAQAALPDLVAKPLLHRANGRQQTITVVGQQFAGPPLGSLLFAISTALPFMVDAATFVVSSALLRTLPRTRRSREAHLPLRAAVAEGLRWLRGHRLLRTLAVLLGVNTFCFQFGNATLVLLATQVLHLDPAGYGLLLAAAAVGAILGGLFTARLVARVGEWGSLVFALSTISVAFVGIGLSPDAIVLAVLLAVNGYATTVWNVVAVGLRQRLVPPELLGRVTSVYRMIGWGLMPLGALTGGIVAHTLGLRAPFPIAGMLRGLALVAAAPVIIRAIRDAA